MSNTTVWVQCNALVNNVNKLINTRTAVERIVLFAAFAVLLTGYAFGGYGAAAASILVDWALKNIIKNGRQVQF